jgi:hypothetical protein
VAVAVDQTGQKQLAAQVLLLVVCFGRALCGKPADRVAVDPEPGVGQGAPDFALQRQNVGVLEQKFQNNRLPAGIIVLLL